MICRRFRPQIPFVVAVAAVVLALVSPSARAEERTVNFYNWSNYVAPGVLEDFTRETGIKVVYDTFDANQTLETRLMAVIMVILHVRRHTQFVSRPFTRHGRHNSSITHRPLLTPMRHV